MLALANKIDIGRGFGLYDLDEPPPRIVEAIEQGATLVAHNAEGFDAGVWEKLVGPASWYDTMHCCRAAGLPAGLDAASKALGGRGKDEAGAKVMKLLTQAKARERGVAYPVGTVEAWALLIRYNVEDVLALEQVYHATADAGEADVMEAHSRINARGVEVDLNLVRCLKNLWREHQENAKARAAKASEGELSGDDLQSVAKVKAWLRKNGIEMPSLERKQVEQLTSDPEGFFGDTDDPRVIKILAVLSNRADAIRATVGKVERVFDVVDEDSRVRNLFVYHGAHTGRWSGRDLQPHNFPRGSNSLDVESLVREFETGGLTLPVIEERAVSAGSGIGDALATLTRPVIRAKSGSVLVICDYAGVEARGVAWMAGERQALQVFADPASDIYCDMASRVYGYPCNKKDHSAERQVGKVIVLGAGYGMGARKFELFCKLSGVDLAEAGVSGEACIKAYRAGYPAIPAGWRELERAARAAVTSGKQLLSTCRCTFFMEGASLKLRLPSGRLLTYRNARIEKLAPAWDRSAAPVDTLTYETPHGYRKTLYGGLLMENVVQAASRDLLADAMVRLDPCFPIVLHVHDELVFEVPEKQGADALREIALAMSSPPAWADGFPVRVEGFTSKRYVKKAFKGSAEADAMLGRMLKFREGVTA